MYIVTFKSGIDPPVLANNFRFQMLQKNITIPHT